MKTVAVVVPWYREPTLDEEISLRHLDRHLGGHDRFALATRGVETPPRFAVRRVPARYLRDPVTYSRLLLSPGFYETFAGYEYLLVYQLDALVFSDELLGWCAKGYDYVGAPWLPGPDAPFVDEPRVGNGGFSLRRVGAFLDVLRTPLSRRRRVEHYARRWLEGKSDSPFRGHEDLFWSFEAQRFAPRFSIAPVAEALRFAFEVEPRRAFELAGGKLPFGCHAWARYDRAFWEPHLLPAGDEHAG